MLTKSSLAEEVEAFALATYLHNESSANIRQPI